MSGYNLGTARGAIEIDQGGLQSSEILLRQTGVALTAAGGAMVGAVGMVIKTSADFEASISAVSAVSDETGRNIDLLREKALELGKRGPYGPKQVADAFIELVKAGLTTEEILAGVGEATVNLAAAGDLALDRAGEILSNTIRTFRLSADEAGHVADVLAGAANASTIDVEDLAVSLKYAGSVAETVGISFEDTANALVVLGNAGIKGSTGGTSLRRILLNLSPASAKARGQLEELGIITEDGSNKFYTAEGKAKSLGEVFDILREATKDLTDEQTVSALNTIFGARAVSSALILLKEGSEGLAAADELVKRTTASDVAEKRLDNLAGSMNRLKAAIEAVFIEAGAPFQSVLKGIVDGIRDLVLWFGEIPAPIQTFILSAIAVIGILTMMGGMLFLMLAPILQLIHLFSVLPGALSTAKAAFAGLTAVAKGFSFALLTNPIFLIITAIIALVAALVYLYFKWQPFRDFVDGLWQGIQQVWDAVLNFFQGLPEKLGAAFNKTKEILGGIFDWIKDNWAGVLLAVVFPPIGIPKLIHDNWDTIKDKAEGAKDAVVGFAETVGGTAAEKVGSFASTVSSSFTQGTEGIRGWLGGAVDAVNQWGLDLAINGPAKVGEFFSRVGEILSQLPGMVGYWLGYALGRTIRFGVDLVAAAARMGSEFITTTALWLARLPGLIQEWITRALYWIITTIPQFTAQAVRLGSEFLASVAVWLSRLPERIQEWLTGAVNTIVRLIPLFIANAGRIASGIWDVLWNGLKGLPGLFMDIFGGLVNIIKNLAKRGVEAARGFAGGIWDGIRAGLGIRSPSYVEEAFWAMEDNVLGALNRMVKDIKVLSQLRNLSSTLDFMSSPLVMSSVSPYASQAAALGDTNITEVNLTVNNPTGEPTEDSLHREMQQLAIHGILPPVNPEN